MRKNSGIGICAVLLSIGVAACSRSATYHSKDGTVTVERQGKDAGAMTITGKNGEKMAYNVNGGKMPDDYPKDVPVYEGTKVILTQSATDKHMNHLVLESNDPADKIADFYKKGLESNGWKIDGTMNMGGMNMVTASKDNRQVVVQISDSKDKRSISQITSDK